MVFMFTLTVFATLMKRSIAEYILDIAISNRTVRLCWISFSTKYQAAEITLAQSVIPGQLNITDKSILIIYLYSAEILEFSIGLDSAPTILRKFLEGYLEL